MSSTKKSRGWMLTINNFTENEENSLKTTGHQYLVYQIERGDEGTEHIQAFIYYKNPRVWPKKHFPRAHIEPSHRGTEACIKYCSKEDTRIRGPFEDGEKPNQGRRTDLEYLASQVQAGVEMDFIAQEFPAEYIRYHRGLTALDNISKENRKTKPQTIWIWGLSGVGKTKYVFDNHSDIYIKDGTQWWDNYNNQETILIDDFDGKWPFRDLLRLLDRYPYQGQVKGGYVKINSPNIYITCEFHPRDIYKSMDGDDNHLTQILRRFDKIIHMNGKPDEIKLPEEIEM